MLRKNSALSNALAFDRNRWLPIEASRCTVGVTITIVVSTLAGNPAAGALASLGALYTGLAASNGVYHARVRAMIASGLMIGLATTLGALLGHSPIGALVAVLVVAFVTALYSSSSRIAGTVSAQTTAILCVVIGLTLPEKTAINDGLLVFGGSAVQLFLMTVVWPMKPGIPERSALAQVFEGLAKFVRELPERRTQDSPQIPPATQIQDARELLTEAERLYWQQEHDLLFEAQRRAEALRAALVGFAQSDRNFAAIDRASKVRANRVLRSIARCLQTAAERARTGHLADAPIVLKIPAIPDDSAAAKEYLKWLKMVANLIGDCYGSSVRAPLTPNPTNLHSVFSTITKLPDIRSLRSVALQHAVRYAITVEAAFAVSQQWTRSHSYWLPVTVAVVLRQDYGSTFQRGLSRLAGTLLGLALSDLFLKLFHPGQLTLQILTIAMTWFAFASIQASYTIATTAITGFVVFSISVSGVAAGEISSMRLVASVLGVLFALTSYALWPAWHWPQIWETLKLAAEAQSKYCKLVLDTHSAKLAGLIDLEGSSKVGEARSAARALRIQSENLIEAAKVHPRGRDRHSIKVAGEASQLLEENAAMILVAQAAWNTDQPETDEQLRSALVASEALATQLTQVIR